MKQKVLFALIALFSFVSVWANDAQGVSALTIPEDPQDEDYYEFFLDPSPVVIGGQQAPDIPTVSVQFNEFDELSVWLNDTEFDVEGLFTFADGKLTKVEGIDNDKVGIYYIKVTVTHGEGLTAFVPFKTIKRVEPEIVWNRESYEASVNGTEASRYGLYQKYLKKYPWSYVWDLDLNSDEPQPKCWYADTTQDTNNDGEANYDDCTLQFEQFAETAKKDEDKGYAYTWDAIYNDFPDNQLLNDFPTIGYGHNDDTKVNVRFVRFVNDEWVDPINQGAGWQKTLEKDGFAVAAWHEFLLDPEPSTEMAWGGLVAGQTRISQGDIYGVERGDVYYIDGNEAKYATNILQVYPEDHPIYDIRIELSSAEDFASQEELALAAEEITYNDWTLNETSDIYLGDVKYPAIAIDAVDVDGEPVDIDAYDDDKVIVKFYTDADLTEEVDEMIHAGTYYVQVYYPGVAEEEADEPGEAPGNEPAPAAEEDPLEGYVALGDAKQFTITKNTLEVVLQQIYMPYGSSLDALKPVWVVKQAKDDMTRTQDIVVENLGDIIKGTGWAAGEEAETVEPNQVRNYTTSSQPKAYVGRTYDVDGNLVEEGHEDYIATTNTSSANIVAIKGTLTVNIDADDLTKVYGFADPEYTFTAKNQAGEDVEGVTITRADKGYVDKNGKAVGEDVGPHDLTVNFDATHYDLVLIVNGQEADKARLEITQFELTKDNKDGYGVNAENYKEKFSIAKPEVIYNGETQFPDPIITFKHEVLGDVILTDFTKWPKTGKGKRYSTADYTYVHGGATYQYTLEGEEDKVPGSYSGFTKSVTRNAETAEVEEATTIKVDGKGNFTGSKTQTYKIQPAPLAVKVKDYVGDDAKAYLSEATFEMETVDPSDVVELDAAQKETLLAGLAEAIANKNGFEGYTKGDAASETPYTIKVKEEAQTDPAVKMAMPNYALDFTNSDGSLEIKKIELALKAINQRIDYPAPADGKYSAPVANTNVVEDVTVEITDGGVLPEGINLSDLVELKQIATKVGNNPGALVLKKKADADKNIKFTAANGDLEIGQLEEIYLSYENMAQALEDHKGVKNMNVYLSNRKIKEDQWYAMVLPFEFNVPQFSNKLYYGVVDLLDTENASDDVRFKLTVGTVPANTPFMFKLAKDPAKVREEGQANVAMTADELATICFEDVTIGDGEFAYNDAEKAPFSVDAANHKFVGVYPTLKVDAKGNKFGKLEMAENEWFISSANGGFYSGAGNANQKMLQTDAFISFPTAEAGAKARFFIEDADGTVTAIEGIDAEIPAEGNADAAREGWYTINGVKLNAQPTQKGLYIFNGKKVYVK